MYVPLGEYEGVKYLLAVLPRIDERVPPVPEQAFFRLIIILDDAQISSNETLFRFVSHALQAGARSIACGGSAAERVHDAFDEEIVHQSVILKSPLCDDDKGECIPTTWHTNSPLDSLLWEGTMCGCDAFESEHPVVVVLLLNGDPRIAEVEEIARTLPGSLDRVVERD